MEVTLDQIPERCRLTLVQSQQFEQISRREAFNRVNGWTWAYSENPGPGPRRIRLIDARSLSTAGQKEWMQAALTSSPTPTTGSGFPVSPSGDGTTTAREPFAMGLPASAPASVGTGQRDLFVSPEVLALNLPDYGQALVVQRRMQIVQLASNGSWASMGYPNKQEFYRELADHHHISVRTLHRWCRDYVRLGVKGLQFDRPGPLPQGTRLETWARAHLESDYRAGLTKRACYQRLITEITKKQECDQWRVSHLYPVPSPWQAFRFLRSLPPIVGQARAFGAAGLHTAAGYLDREFTERAGDTWCIDEWRVDAHLYLDWEMPTVVRPYVLSICDERSKFLLAWKIVLEPTSETVLDLVEDALRHHFRPLRFYSDRGGWFRGKLGRHYREVPTEKLLGPAAGVLGQLGVLHRGPRNKNPRANVIERNLHGFYAERALATLAGSSCGNTERVAEALGVYARVEAHKELCKRGAVLQETGLLSYRQFEAIFPAWVEQFNARPSQANGLNGLTPAAAWASYAPPAEEIATRQVDAITLAFTFAERYEGYTIRQGGIIELTANGIKHRYSSPLLVLHAGEQRNLRRLRHNDSFIVVEPLPGSNDREVIARRRVRVGINDEAGMAEAIAEQHRVEELLVARYAPDRSPRHTDRTEPSPGHTDRAVATVEPETSDEPALIISSLEWQMAHAKKPPEDPETLEEQPAAAEQPMPHLYDLKPME